MIGFFIIHARYPKYKKNTILKNTDKVLFSITIKKLSTTIKRVTARNIHF